MSTILLVDDHEDTVRVQALFLRKRGYHVETAGTVSAAYAIAAAKTIDLVVSDIRLSDGSGLDLMRKLREEQGIPAIALSGVADEALPSEGRGPVTADRILSKPVPPNALLDAVLAILDPPP